MSPDPMGVTLQVVEALEGADVPYLLVGSVATSAVGLPRSTIDADIVADVRESHVEAIVAALEADFYVDAERIRWALRHRSMFNVVHYATGFKVDIYVLGRRAFDQRRLERRMLHHLRADLREVYMGTPEDLVLGRLDWYRKGNEVSERQWTDILGVLRVRGPELDWGYLERWAAELRLSDLLERARREAGTPPPGG